MPELRATLRLQFHAGFTLDDAVALVDYFAQLGVSHIYASPLLKARPGSTHGYDVIDPTCVNPELGGEPALHRLADALHQRGMGLIMDLVPNHMAVDNHNPWWQDVLLWGKTSAYANFFDINWHSHDPLLRDRVLLPILAAVLASMLETLIRLRLPGSWVWEHVVGRIVSSPGMMSLQPWRWQQASDNPFMEPVTWGQLRQTLVSIETGIGLLVAVALLAAAIWLRRYRDDS